MKSASSALDFFLMWSAMFSSFVTKQSPSFEMVSYTWTWRIIWRRLLTKVYMLVMLFEVAMVVLQKATHAHAQKDWPGIWLSSGLTSTLYLQIGFRLEKTTLFFFYSITADWFHCRLSFSWAYLAWLSVVDYQAALWTAYPVFSFRGVTAFLDMICQLPLIFLLAFLYICFTFILFSCIFQARWDHLGIYLL